MKKIYWSFLLLGTIGFLDSLYLAIIHFTNNSVVCNGTNECDLVLTSSYATFLGIPLALFGIIFYIYIIIISTLMLEKIKLGQNVTPKLIVPFAFIGFVASMYFVYIQAFVLNAYCTYCMVSAVSSTIIFILANIYCYKVSKDKSA
jgi:uncharacterized membrane protein